MLLVGLHVYPEGKLQPKTCIFKSQNLFQVFIAVEVLTGEIFLILLPWRHCEKKREDAGVPGTSRQKETIKT